MILIKGFLYNEFEIYFIRITMINASKIIKRKRDLSKDCQNQFKCLENSRKSETYLNILIFKRMIDKQKIPINYLFKYDLVKIRTNYICWIYNISTKTEISYQTIFNTITLIDDLCILLKETIEIPSNFQLLAITCFFLSYKVFEKKAITVGFVQKNLLCNNWKEEDIRKAEIFVLNKLDYKIHSVNFYSFYQYYEDVLNRHFKGEIFNKIDFLVYFFMRKSLTINDFYFNLNPFNQIKIILNTVFMLMSELTNFDMTNYHEFYIEFANLSNLSSMDIYNFEKYSRVLITSLNLTDEFIKKFLSIE